jgi:predicted histone-like DNA-binding protein
MASEGKIDTEQLCKYIEKNSSISEQDIKILMRALAEVISENVEMGRGVNLEELGVFSPNLRTKGEREFEKVSADNIEKVVVNFRPASSFRKEMDNAPVKESTKYKLKHVN